jgi:predicted DNA-binding transcriptional regulator AlpA
MTNQTESIVLGIEQVAHLLGIHPNSIRISIKKPGGFPNSIRISIKKPGGLPSHRIGRRIVILRRELEEWLSNQPGARTE